MSNGPVILYKASDNTVLDEWESSKEPLWEKWKEETAALRAEFGGRDILRRNYGWSKGWMVSGYVEPDRNAEPLPGFRRDRNSDHMVPALRSKAGKELEKRLNSIRYEPAPTPGLPQIVMGGGYMGGFSIAKLDGVWFAWLGFDPYAGETNQQDMKEVDTELWVEAKFSEYYAAREKEAA